MALLKPAPLKKGDRIGVIAPAGAVRDEQLRAGVDALHGAGFIVELSDTILERKGYLAGPKEKRAEALQNFFRREDIKAIFCARGGFGSVQLLPLLDRELIRAHPKVFVGCSDISLLLNWIAQSCGMVAFHGPMVAMDIARGLRGRSRDFLWKTVLGKKRRWQIAGVETVRPGEGKGEMVGGCLSVVVTTLGTPFEINTTGKILFLEDVGEKPYRIERMLTHLQMAGKLDKISGLVFGSFTGCSDDGERGLNEIIRDLFRDSCYPVVAGLAAGHGDENLLLPFGVKMELDGDAGVLSLLESPVR